MAPTLKVPHHQVAGHQATGGNLGPLIDEESGCFYKPLQNNERGNRELSFYTSFTSNTNIPPHISKFFPVFYGTKSIDASDGSGPRPHLILEDITSNYTTPSIMDVKIGSRTWYPQAPDSYYAKCLKKDRETSSLCLGFRVSGIQVYTGGEELGYWKSGKVTQYYDADNVRLLLQKFVSSRNNRDDCSLAEGVYGGNNGVLQQLHELKSWFEGQTFYHFFSCSILMVYDGESKKGKGLNH